MKIFLLLVTLLSLPQIIYAQAKIGDDQFIADKAKRLKHHFSQMEKLLSRFLAIDGNTTFNKSKEKYMLLKLEEAEKEAFSLNESAVFREIVSDSHYYQLKIALPARDVIKDIELIIENYPPYVMLEEAKKLSVRVKKQDILAYSRAFFILRTLRRLERNAQKTAIEVHDSYEEIKRLGDGDVIKAMGFGSYYSIVFARAWPSWIEDFRNDYESIIWCLIEPRDESQTTCY